MSAKKLRNKRQDAVNHLSLEKAAECLAAGRVGDAETLCREVLKLDATNVSAMCMLADIGIRMGATADAEKLLLRCLELAPDYHIARGHYANWLFKQQRFDDALEALDAIAAVVLGNFSHTLLRANIYVRIGKNEEALDIYRRLVVQIPQSASLQLSLGHTLKTLGCRDEAVAAYRQTALLEPHNGEAYWSLANLKTYTFSAAEIAAMRVGAASEEIGREDFLHLCFALGKALEDLGEYDDSFLHYRRGNAVRRRTVPYRADANHDEMRVIKSFFTKEQIAKLQGHGAKAADPIFIVGLPRAGSTLIEQILASHSQVEGTQELPDIMSIARRLGGKEYRHDRSNYPQILAELSPQQLVDLGEEYLARTRLHRTGTPRFIDKMPNNFAHIGLIHLILPNAIIIDARRSPMDCCFSGYKQLFAKGQNFTYSLNDVGRYYSDYVDLMRHWDAMLPGKVIRIFNEDMIADPEGQIRQLLQQCGLPFEAGCLEFHRNQRAVRTASSEQVRQPINASGVGRWRNFERHLGPLKAALGSNIDLYRQ